MKVEWLVSACLWWKGTSVSKKEIRRRSTQPHTADDVQMQSCVAVLLVFRAHHGLLLLT